MCVTYCLAVGRNKCYRGRHESINDQVHVHVGACTHERSATNMKKSNSVTHTVVIYNTYACAHAHKKQEQLQALGDKTGLGEGSGERLGKENTQRRQLEMHTGAARTHIERSSGG